VIKINVKIQYEPFYKGHFTAFSADYLYTITKEEKPCYSIGRYMSALKNGKFLKIENPTLPTAVAVITETLYPISTEGHSKPTTTLLFDRKPHIDVIERIQNVN
jgi:hypothetical protein